MSRPDKQSVTTQLLSGLTDAVPWDVAMSTWWINQRDTGGLRLTSAGYQYLLENGVKHHVLDIDRKLLSQPSTLLVLDRYIDDAYFLDTKAHRLVLFGSQQAVMAELYQDMSRFLASLSS